MAQAFGLLALIFIAMLGWAVWQSQDKRPSPYTDISKIMPQPVIVLDVEMPFSSMILFMVKLALASIPALIIITIAGAILFAMLSAVGMAYPPLTRY